MMHSTKLLAILTLTVISGCALLTGGRDPEGWALRHMMLADSLEQGSMFRQASAEYDIVVQRYRGTSQFPKAVKELVNLNINPLNPNRSDSAALSWITVYLALALPKEEIENARMYYMLLQRIRFIQTDIDRQTFVADSVMAATKRQNADAAALNRRVQELEADLKQANMELAKLKEVDVRLSKARGKK